MIPDFESFIRLDEHKIYGHTWAGMFRFDLPLAIVFSFIFHNIIRDPLINNLPVKLGNRFRRYVGFYWNFYFRQHFVMIIFSMLTGIALHLLWDAFTHLNLANPDAVDSAIYVGNVQLFKILQDVNSAVGLIIVVVYIYMLPNTVVIEMPREQENMIYRIEQPEVKRNKALYWLLVLVINAVTVLMATTLLNKDITIVLLIDIIISGMLLGLIAAPIIQQVISGKYNR